MCRVVQCTRIQILSNLSFIPKLACLLAACAEGRDGRAMVIALTVQNLAFLAPVVEVWYLPDHLKGLFIRLWARGAVVNSCHTRHLWDELFTNMYVCVCRSVCLHVWREYEILKGEGNGRKWREKAVRHVCIYNLFGEARRRNCSRLQRAILEVRGTHVDTVHKMHTKQ